MEIELYLYNILVEVIRKYYYGTQHEKRKVNPY